MNQVKEEPQNEIGDISDDYSVDGDQKAE